MEERTITVKYEDGQEEALTVREMPTARWPKASEHMGREGYNDFALADLACNKPVGWSLTLKPASFMEVQAAVIGLNTHFFGRAVLQRQWRDGKVQVLRDSDGSST